MQQQKIKKQRSTLADANIKTYVIKYITNEAKDRPIFSWNCKADNCNDAGKKLMEKLERTGEQIQSFTITKEIEIGRFA